MSLWMGVALMLAAALAVVLLPAWREESAPAGRRIALLGVLGGLPAVTVGLYLFLGAPAIIEEQALTQAQSRYDAEGMVEALEGKLRATPDDPEGWYALGRAYIAFEKYAQAEEALRKATTQAPKDPRIIAQYAEAIALKQNSLDGRPMELVMQALELSYEEEKALELAGLAAFQKEKWAEALHYWRRLLKRLPKESEHHDAIAGAVRTAESRLQASLRGSGMALPAPRAETRQAPH